MAEVDQANYDVVKARLDVQLGELQQRADALNAKRKGVFGGTELELLVSERLRTENNCIPRDATGVSGHLLVAYEVFLGLKAEMNVGDVLAVHKFVQQPDGTYDLAAVAHEGAAAFLADPQFAKDLLETFRYMKGAKLSRLRKTETRLLVSVQVGSADKDIKVFRFAIDAQSNVTYMDSRGDEDNQPPRSHDFEWTLATRENHVLGEYPHVSVFDEIFVETVGGTLTFKVENNTQSGHGIHSEPVDNANQQLADADIAFARCGGLIVVRVKPFGEATERFYAYAPEVRKVFRVDEIGLSCVALPEDQGIVFPGGYCLKNGQKRSFDGDVTHMELERVVRSPNGEDSLFVYFRWNDGQYVLMPYNAISKEMAVPIRTNGMSLFPDGRLAVFRAATEATRVHPIQVWRTPFQSEEFAASAPTDGSYLAKVGNRDLVRGISDAISICRLGDVAEPSRRLYEALVRELSRFVDAYYWLGHAEALDLLSVVTEVRDTAETIIDEFEKAEAFRLRSGEALAKAEREIDATLEGVRLETKKDVETFLLSLSLLRTARGQLVHLRDMRSIDLAAIDSLDVRVRDAFDQVSRACVELLATGSAFEPFTKSLAEIGALAEAAAKTPELAPHEARIVELEAGLTLLNGVVSNLVIEDPTVRTRILEDLGVSFGELNRARAVVQSKKKELFLGEGKAEFAAQRSVFTQAVSSALALSSTPEKCDAELARLLLVLEELEGKFGQIDEFLLELGQQREDLVGAFGARRQSLQDERQKRTTTLAQAGDRMLGGIDKRARACKSEEELFAYFAADAMVEKMAALADQLVELGDTVRADELRTRLASVRQDALRTLRDKNDLSADGPGIVKLGQAAFSVQEQPIELVLVQTGEGLSIHLTGTDFYQPVHDAALDASKQLWEQTLVSEAAGYSRSEYLAAGLLFDAESHGTLGELTRLASQPEELARCVREAAVARIEEGYERGIHDSDATLLLAKIVPAYAAAELLRYRPADRALACLFWAHAATETKQNLERRARSAAKIREEFGAQPARTEMLAELTAAIGAFVASAGVSLGSPAFAAEYLFEELAKDSVGFVTSESSARLLEAMLRELDERGQRRRLEDDLRSLAASPREALQLVRPWVRAYAEAAQPALVRFADEAAVLLLTESSVQRRSSAAALDLEVTGLLSQHPRITQRALSLSLDEWLAQMQGAHGHGAEEFRAYRKLRGEVLKAERERLRLSELQPKVLTSFVRNRLIDEVYLPLVGKNLAKQIGTTGADKRTDRMGLLLLLSPPGYGKTTLMEYVAGLLGLVFVKVNGPSLGHEVRSLDPEEAPNATARQEVQKINLAFEMGNNVMLYLDDIQHTHTELLQKFISLCDAQRRIEGVWNGRTKTYDLRGKKFCVIMAGNPYTETGDRFQIPDMLANRADTYNLGEVLDGKDELFALSYLENALTSNRVLQPLAARKREDTQLLVRLARGEAVSTTGLSHPYAAAETAEIVAVLERLFQVQRTLLAVNREYIRSAAQADAFRTEPPFKLQGSYRNMNKLTEKVASAMTEAEVERLVDDHYASESQTLTQGAEFNLLRLRELRSRMDPAAVTRLAEIRDTFGRNLRMGGSEADPVARLAGSISTLEIGLKQIGAAVERGHVRADDAKDETRARSGDQLRDLRELLNAQMGLMEHALAALAAQKAAPVVQRPSSVPRPVAEPGATAAQLSPRFEEIRVAVAALDKKLGSLALGSTASFEVELGPGTSSHLYCGIADSDVIAAGGLFIATYAKPPSLGTRIQLELVFPGGKRAKASGVVVFTRDLVEGTGMVEPGFGVRFGELEHEARHLIASFAAKHTPMLRDD